MLSFLIGLAVRVVVFGIVLTFATKKIARVKVEPHSALPLVALTFALLNSLLYWFLSGALNIMTLWILSLFVPFVVNAILLWLTDKLMRFLTIDGLKPLMLTAGLITIAHMLLRATLGWL